MPPPVHGVSVTNKKILDSELISQVFTKDVIPFQFSSSIEEIDKLSAGKLIKTFKILIQIVSKCFSKRPDLVYFTLSVIGNTFYRDVVIVSILKFFRMNIVYHLHRIGVRDTEQSGFIRKLLYRWVFNKTLVIHLTPRLYNDVQDYVKKENCFFVSNGIDDPIVDTCEFQHTSDEQPVRFSFLSHMVAEKGVIVMLEALVELQSRGIVFEAVFAGGRISPECGNAFSTLLPAHGLQDRVKYIGPVYDEEKEMFYNNSDVFVFPSLYDSFGIVLLEAMAHALPVIATIQGGIPDVVDDGKNGYLVEKNNILMLADKMELLAKNENLRHSMGDNGRRKFENNYTTTIFESNMLDTLNACIKKY